MNVRAQPRSWTTPPSKEGSVQHERLGVASTNAEAITQVQEMHPDATWQQRALHAIFRAQNRRRRLDDQEGEDYPSLLQLAGSRRSSLAGMVNGG